MNEYTSDQLVAMMHAYTDAVPRLTIIHYHGTIYSTREGNEMYERGQKIVKKPEIVHSATTYLLEKGIPRMRETLPPGVLQKLEIDLNALEEKCTHLRDITSQQLNQKSAQRRQERQAWRSR